MIRTFLIDRNGSTSVEYGLVAALFGICLMAVWKMVGSQIGNTFSSAAAALMKA